MAYGEHARTEKAVRLEYAVRTAGFATPPVPEDARRAAEATAGVRRGSDETWALVEHLLTVWPVPPST